MSNQKFPFWVESQSLGQRNCGIVLTPFEIEKMISLFDNGGSIATVEDETDLHGIEHVNYNMRKAEEVVLNEEQYMNDPILRSIILKIWERVHDENEKSFQLEIDKIGRMHALKYEDGGHYDWHFDGGIYSPQNECEKLTALIGLNYPEEYEGGHFCVAPDEVGVKMLPGEMYLIPGHTLHRITPVTSGVRYSLVMYFIGPKFR